MKRNLLGGHSEPWAATQWTKADAYALKALANGTANEAQQKRALDWILRTCGLRDLSFRPESDRATAFAEGKRFVGLQIAKMMQLPAGVIEAAENAANKSGKR
jgi:hypothetical protein